MGKGISLILMKNQGSGLDITPLVESVRWSGRKGSSSRTIDVSLLDDNGFQHARSGINVEEGHQVIFSYNDKELFRGIIMSQTQTQRKKMTFKAYDNGIYLANNKDTFVYENMTASAIFSDVCARFGIPMGEVSGTSYVIPELTKPKTTGLDVILDALSLDFDATGIRHYVRSEGGKVSLITRKENILQWVIEVGANLTSYSYSRSIEKLRTRVKIISKEGTTVAEKVKGDMESRVGMFQEVEEVEEAYTQAQVQSIIDNFLENSATPERAMSLEALGNVDITSGIGVYIIIPDLDIKRTFYVDQDTHTFKDQAHTMNLKLTYASDVSKEEPGKEEEGKKEHNVGDVVQFNGGPHYVSSNATSPTGTPCNPGPAKITLQAKGAKHPWHLIHTDGQSRVYGWVDEGTFS